MAAKKANTSKSAPEAEDDQKHLKNRLSRIEGQVRGVKGMLERGSDFSDILIQVSAINAALKSFDKEILETYVRESMKESIESGSEKNIDEIIKTMKRLMK